MSGGKADDTPSGQQSWGNERGRELIAEHHSFAASAQAREAIWYDILANYQGADHR